MAPSDWPAIGRLAAAELPDAEALVAQAGWNQVAADWRIFLEFGTVYAVRAEGRVVATAATLPYGGRCGEYGPSPGRPRRAPGRDPGRDRSHGPGSGADVG